MILFCEGPSDLRIYALTNKEWKQDLHILEGPCVYEYLWEYIAHTHIHSSDACFAVCVGVSITPSVPVPEVDCVMDRDLGYVLASPHTSAFLVSC